MQIEPMGNVPYCKELWSAIACTTHRCDKSFVIYEIENANELLKEGLNFFKSFSEASLQEIQKENPLGSMYDLISQLAPLLNVDAKLTLELTCNFIMNEFRGNAENFTQQLMDLTSRRQLIQDIWNFYYCERIALLKCLKLMIEYRDNEKHPHHKEFAKFFERTPLNTVLQSALKHLDLLKFHNPSSRSHLMTEDYLCQLYNSSLVEMRELLHIITLLVESEHPTNFDAIYSSCCGEPRRLTSAKSHDDKEILLRKLDDIHQSQIALFIVIMDVTKRCSTDQDLEQVSKWIHSVRSSMQDTLGLQCLRDSETEDGPLLLAWMLANYAIEPDNTETMNNFRPFGMRAVQLDVFRTINSLMNTEMIAESTRYAQAVRSSVYNLLSLLCNFVDEEKIGNFTGIFEAVASTLRYRETSLEFWKDEAEEAGLWLIYRRAASLFPYRYEPLTTIATGLAAASATSANKIAAKLETLATVTLEVPRHRNALFTADGGTSYRPFNNSALHQSNNFTIPADTEFSVIANDHENEVITWQIKFRYGDAFRYKIAQLFSQAARGVMNVSALQTSVPEHVSMSFDLLEALLTNNAEVLPGMVEPTELSLEIINKFSYATLPRSLYRVVAACCRVSALLVRNYPDEIVTRMQMGVYPKFNDWYQDFKDLARAVSFDGGLVASWLSSIETIEHRYPVLNAYLDTLHNFIKNKNDEDAVYNIEMPGIVFLLQGVLPKLDSWYFASETERIELWLKTMLCIHSALGENVSKYEAKKKLQLVVAYSLMYLEPRHALLKLIRTGDQTLRSKMMNESDWVSGKGFKIIESVRLALSLVNRLLMCREVLGLSHDERSPLEVALYTSPSLPSALLIVPTIVNYLFVEFSASLQAMAVNLLKKFAQSFSMSLLVCMGMDGTSIRGTFASRLSAATCSLKVKIAILDLVAVCLERQPGLTDALFNIMHSAEQKRLFPRPTDQLATEGCNKFLIHYLKRIAVDEQIVSNKMYDSTMNLLRAMWYNRNNILVNYFRKQEHFWSQLFAPLFRPFVKNSPGYAHLIDIITLELFECSPLLLTDSDFEKNLKKLLHQDNHWNNLIKYILDSLPAQSISMDEEKNRDANNSTKITAYESNIEAWYNFIVTLTDRKVSSELMSKMEASRVQYMLQLTLDSLSMRVKRMENAEDARITMVLASLALRCVVTWRSKCVDEPKAFVEKIIQLMMDIFHSYTQYAIALRQTLVSLLLGCIQLVKTAIADDRASFEYLLIHACQLSGIELRKISAGAARTRNIQAVSGNAKHISAEEQETLSVTSHSEAEKTTKECTPATLTISMVTQLLRCSSETQSEKIASKSACLHLRQLVPELMNCLSDHLHKYHYVAFSRAAFGLLGTIVRLPNYNPPPRPVDDEEALAKLLLALIPPVELGQSMLEYLYDDRACENQWRCYDWFGVYALGLELLTGMVLNDISLAEPCSTHVPPVIIFVGSHEHLLTEIATLLRHTGHPICLDSVTIDLVQSLVSLISALTMRTVVWEMIQPSMRDALMNCMFLIYDSTVNLLLRPRILKFIIDGVSMELTEDSSWCDDNQPSCELKLVVNKLIVINWWCTQCFLRFSPRLNTLVDTIYTQEFWHTPLAEMNFGPPQMSMSVRQNLTYGAIISSTQLFTQALNSQLAPSLPADTSTTSANVTTESSKRNIDNSTATDHSCKTYPKNFRRLYHGSPGPSLDFTAIGAGGESPRILRRPYDSLICENTILSRSATLTHGGRVSKNGASNSPGHSGTIGQLARLDSSPWFDLMNKSNSRLALEVNLVLLLCQTLEGVKSPRMALRDRQLIARETANEIGVFFDLIDERVAGLNEWEIEGVVFGAKPDDNSVEIVRPSEKVTASRARLQAKSTVNRAPVGVTNHDPSLEVAGTSRASISELPETRLDDEIITTGGFKVQSTSVKFLPLLRKLFKSIFDSLDSTQYG